MTYQRPVSITNNCPFVFSQNALNPVMIFLFGVSVFLGLPLHVLALSDLEDTLYEAEENFMRANAGTQTADDNTDRTDSDTGQKSDMSFC